MKEAETQQKRIDKLIAEGADEADVRKQASQLYLYSYRTVAYVKESSRITERGPWRDKPNDP